MSLASIWQCTARGFWELCDQKHHILLHCYRYAEQNTAAGWDAEWVHAYSQYEEQQRQQDERDHSEFFGQSAGFSRSFNRSDPLGYYNILGLEPGASKQEIQVAPC